ncbi:MAG: metallophosphoesterase [Clostridiaceae bacterium]|nr:metallophosphoesterase [Clostridiaceae bacterium]
MRKTIKRTMVAFLAIVLLAVSLPLPVSAHPEHLPNNGTNETYMGRTLYTGQFHSHTSLSDGVKLPKDAYEMVRNNTTLDFYAVTDHDVLLDMRNGDDYITDVNDALSEDWRVKHATADQYNEDGKFVAITGEEITWYDNSGHINLYNTAWKITAFAKTRYTWVGSGDVKYDLPTFYARLAQDPNAIAQFNHPNPTGKGDFWTFSHYTKEADAQMHLFEYNSTGYLGAFQNCLDAGWHVAPTWNADEHSANWGSSAARTGVWADDKTRESLYKAFRERTVYSSFDKNFQLTFSANDAFMGSILPANATQFNMYAKLYDPDANDLINEVTLYTNNRQVVKQWTNVGSNLLEINETFPCADGDYFFLVVKQADGNQIISAPMWIGETTRGTNIAPEITVNGTIPETIELNQPFTLPTVTALDDTDGVREVTVDVSNYAGTVEIVDGTFTPDSYDDYFIRYRAKDSKGSTRVELFRTTVNSANMEPDNIFGQFAPVATVGATADQAGVNVVTNTALMTAYLQIVPAADADWANAQTIASEQTPIQMEIASQVAAPNYAKPITEKPMRSHSFDLTGLTPGTDYKYRLGVSETGEWTSKEYSFKTVLPEGKTSLYVMGDLQVPGTEKSKYDLFTNMLNVLKEKEPDGSVMLQVGDFVDDAGQYSYWKTLGDYVIADIGLLNSPVIGNHETYHDYNAGHSYTDSPFSGKTTFGKMFNLPKNGSVVGDSNYSYDIGEMHIAVLNSTTGLDEQLRWLTEDMRVTEKPWRIVTGHFPYFGSSHSTDAGMAEAREKVAQACQQLGVNLYLGGHDHVYKRTTIRNGEATNAPEDISQGTTFVTAGSAGPKFYNNVEFWWDHVVYDEDVQTGMVLSADADSLTLTAYNVRGEVIDQFTLGHPRGLLEISSADIEDKQWKGIGLLATEDMPENVTVLAAKYTEDEGELLDIRVTNVSLLRHGREQYIPFATPMDFDSSNLLKVMVWESLGTARPLLPAKILRKGMKGFGTEEQPYELYTWEDFDSLAYEPAAHFLLMNDLNLDGAVRAQQGYGGVDFFGVFDGGGHSITGYKADPGKGTGLFATNDGVIRNLHMDGTIVSNTKTAGLICDLNRGTIENCYVSGSISAPSRVGGMVGDSYGIVRNCYSTADVRSRATEAGGVVGLGMGGSLTENCYATGSIRTDTRNAGGVVGYGYNNTTVRNCIALNEKVDGIIYSNRVIGRILAGNTATLENNYGSIAVMVVAEQQGTAAGNTEKGITASLAETKDPALYRDNLGWDFDNVWQWSESGKRPVLRMRPEEIDPDAGPKPALEKDANGYYKIATAADLTQISQFPEEKYILTADITLTEPFAPLCVERQFLGVLDGAGHKISGYTSNQGGLVWMNAGTIRNLALTDAVVNARVVSGYEDGTGILCNRSSGLIEQCYTTGSITGNCALGGIVGNLSGTLRNCYSTADVTVSGPATGDKYAGGVVGIPVRYSNSVIENCYSTGAIAVVNNESAGGITGYTYSDSTVRNNFALNKSVAAINFAHRIAARTLGSEVAALENNFALNNMPVSIPAPTEDRTPGWMGIDKTPGEARNQSTFASATDAGGLGWDFDNVWQWSENGQRPVLRAIPEEIAPAPEEKPDLEKDANGYYKIASAADLAVISEFPEENYVLTGDINLHGATVEQLCRDTAFVGIFDGAGYRIKNYSSDSSGGLFKNNSGTIRRLGMTNAAVRGRMGLTDFNDGTGILCDKSNGTIEECYTSGSITGSISLGGIVGNHSGTLRNCYSTADVTVSGRRYAGGLVGISVSGSHSVIENSYATGAVSTGSDESAAGITGYTYKDSTVRNCFALNKSITASKYAHRVAARTLNQDVATLENNFALDNMPVNTPAPYEDRTPGWMGIDKTAAEAKNQNTFANATDAGGLGWDFAAVWQWDATAERPVLRNCLEDTGMTPSLPQNGEGYYEVASAADLVVISEFPAENYILTDDIDLNGQTLGQLCRVTAFSGVFDGAGYRIMNYTSDGGGGLFRNNEGTIRRLGMTKALVKARAASSYNDGTGILCDRSSGLIEGCYTEGRITGSIATGGVVGNLSGILRNCYSTADVNVDGSSYAGGLVAISDRYSNSVIENCYATGDVLVMGSTCAGGITGYTYADSTVRNCFALNRSIVASQFNAEKYAHRIAARTLNQEVAKLQNNFALADMPVNEPVLADFRAASWMGIDKTAAAAEDQATFANVTDAGGLGWDFADIWQWDDVVRRPVLRNCLEDTGAKPALPQDANGYYKVASATDLAVISEFPTENYVLTRDIDLSGEKQEQLCRSVAFAGIFDGAGYRIMNYTCDNGGGLFKKNNGTIRRLGLTNAVVKGRNVRHFEDGTGILCDRSNGLIEECYTTGSLTGSCALGGIVGNLGGTLRNCYSTADVTVQGRLYAGGLVGISVDGSNSLIENCYATGAVTVVNNETAAGITGYTYEDSTVRNCFALNTSITATKFAHRIAARTLLEEVSTLENNFALADMPVNTSAPAEARTPGWMGIDKTAAEANDQATFANATDAGGLGWDFAAVWQWDAMAQRPTLKCFG